MRGHIRQRGKESWGVTIYLGMENGKRKYRSFTVHGTKKDAERELRRVLRELDTGSYVEPSKLTVEQYLERWLSDYASLHVSGRTLERYQGIIRAHLIPGLGKRPLSKLQPLDIQKHYAESLRDGRKDGKGGLSAQTVLHHHRVLHEALEQAVKWQLLARNPADAVEPPRPRRQEMQVLDEAQAAMLLKATRESPLYIPILLALTTGMRRGEILGLRWKDVDLNRGVLAVRRAAEVSGRKVSYKEPKTARSRRVVTLLGLTVDELRRHKREQAENKLFYGPAYEDHGLVCCHDDGRPFHPDRVSYNFAALIRRLDLPRIRFHDLRHTHATLLLAQGVHPKVVSERLGHSTIGLTMDTYSHVLPVLQEEAASKLDSTLRDALKKQA